MLGQADADIGKKQPDPTEPEETTNGTPCTPYGSAVTETKSYWYIVQPEDLGSFWAIPTKFNLPAQGPGGTWRWHELRNANLDWPGGFVEQNTACVLQGLYAGAKLHVPASWPEPKPGVAIEPKKKNGFPGGEPSPGTATAAIIVGIVGVAGITALAYVAHKQKKGRS